MRVKHPLLYVFFVGFSFAFWQIVRNTNMTAEGKFVGVVIAVGFVIVSAFCAVFLEDLDEAVWERKV